MNKCCEICETEVEIIYSNTCTNCICMIYEYLTDTSVSEKQLQLSVQARLKMVAILNLWANTEWPHIKAVSGIFQV